MGNNKKTKKASIKTKRIMLGENAQSFFDASTGIFIGKGETKELSVRQYTSPKIKRALTNGHLVIVTGDIPDLEEDNAEDLKAKFDTLMNQGMEVAKIAKAFTMKEIKAVATGNPLIKEKMEIDNDVQRLKLLKASYDNQRYALQDNFMIRYPKLIKAANEKLVCVREDIKLRDRELLEHPDFAITVGKFTYTERADGGAVMLEAVSKCKTGDTTALGSFHGFELLVEKNFMGVNYLILRGKTEYKVELSTSPVGNMVKLENCFNGIHENEEYLLKKIEQYENDLAASKEEYEKPFMHEEELQQKLSRQFELNAQLDLENEKVADADLGGIEEEKSMNVAENQLPYQTRQDKPREKEVPC